jgi:two-component system chemotaxis response regulator CheY
VTSVDTGPCILVVDDDYDVRQGIAEVLEDEGYLPALASNGAEALQLLREGLRPSLILLDLMMPVMDGETFCRRWRSDGPADIPIVIISADAAAKEKSRGCGAAALLRKPVQLQTLLETAERFARGSTDEP